MKQSVYKSYDELPLFFSSTGTPFILGEAKPFKLEIEEWAKEELMLINNVISVLSKGVFSPALVCIARTFLLSKSVQEW